MSAQKNTLKENANAKTRDKISEQDVVQYLKNHPDFFQQHSELLAQMSLEHNSGSAVSIIERQVSILREQKNEAHSRLHTLIEVADKNEQLSRRFNALILALLDTQSFGQVVDFVQQRLVKDFDAHQISIRILKGVTIAPKDLPSKDQMLAIKWDKAYLSMFGKIIEQRTPVCGRLPLDQLELLFNDNFQQIRSAALIPLVKDDKSDCIGLLAIGSTDKDRFHAEMGTLFLSHLSQVLSRVIERHVRREA